MRKKRKGGEESEKDKEEQTSGIHTENLTAEKHSNMALYYDQDF